MKNIGVRHADLVTATRHMTPFRRWLKRSVVMCVTTLRFHYVIFRNTADLLRQDGLNDWATWRSLLSYLYRRPGTMRLLLSGVFTYIRRGFHPWNIDNRHLLEKAIAILDQTETAKDAA